MPRPDTEYGLRSWAWVIWWTEEGGVEIDQPLIASQCARLTAVLNLDNYQ